MSPQKYLEELLQLKNMSVPQLAKKIGTDVHHLRDILLEKKPINRIYAFRLEHLFGISREFWLRSYNFVRK